MTVRKTSAFAAERKKPKHGTLDFYPTPAWATEALFEHVIPQQYRPKNELIRRLNCWEPACGKGDMSKVLENHFSTVISSDVKNYGFEKMNFVFNFITGNYKDLKEKMLYHKSHADWIITNPPFNLADRFILKSLEIARYGVAIFGKIQLLEGATRWRDIYCKTPPSIIAPFASRVTLYENKFEDKGGQIAFAWFVWIKDETNNEWNTDARVIWIPPREKGDPRQNKMFDKKDAEK